MLRFASNTAQIDSSVFQSLLRLPRGQQQKIAAIIEPFIAHHAGR